MRTLLLTSLAMVAFAGNSILCRLSLRETSIDPASFTSVRILSGAVALWLILRLQGGTPRIGGSWPSAFALFAYAAGFSFAYVSLPASTGALLLFGAVQATMIGYGLWSGERLRGRQWAGMLIAVGGLVGLFLPGLSAPPVQGSLLMLGAGAAWGVYSLRGRKSGGALRATAGNFARAVPFAVGMSVALLARGSVDRAGLLYAVTSGALASGVGYAVWYTALRGLRATAAATVQLSVPVLASAGGIVLLDEPLTPRLVVASIAILGGIAMVVLRPSAR